MAKENRSWAMTGLSGAADQMVGNVLRLHGIPSEPERKRTTAWAEFIRVHLAVLAGTDFFMVEVLTLRGL